MTRKGKTQKKQKAGLNRSMLDVGIGYLKDAIQYKLSEAEGVYVEVPTQKIKPTQRCNSCWELTPKTLADRLHICSHCGHTEDRDVNAAQVCLTWVRGQELSSKNVEGEALPKSCGSFRQLASLT